MTRKILFEIIGALLMVGMVSCMSEQKQSGVNNSFATPVGCVKEYLYAKSERNMSRMLNCYLYDTKFERILREGLQDLIDKEDGKVRGYTEIKRYQIDSVKLKAEYPNSAVVTVNYTATYSDNDVYSGSYDLNLVKDAGNWKLEAEFGYSINAN